MPNTPPHSSSRRHRLVEILRRRAPATPARVWLYGLVLAAIFEAITAALRFGVDLQIRQDTAFMAPLTFGWRIHHGYTGTAILLAALAIPAGPWRRWTVVLGLALLGSDLAHHFLILWPLTGSPEFDLRYPGF
jgi:hypothetical protein